MFAFRILAAGLAYRINPLMLCLGGSKGLRKVFMQSLKEKTCLFARHFLSIFSIFLVLTFFRYPFFLNSDHFFTSDEGMLASAILDLLGGSIRFYYDFGTTFGLTFGLVSVPLILLWGPTSLAFNLPATFFYALYLWTTYLIAKKVIPRTAYMVLMLMLFAPFSITALTTHNWPHVPAAFLGNCIFLLFIKFKFSKENNMLIIFLLFFAMGLAIYTYTYSLIFILTITILYALTHSQWDKIKKNISLTYFWGILKNKKSKKEAVCQLIDFLISIFFLVVCFSYVFGGFAFDIGGVSILQVKEFHNAALQLVALIFIRILINPESSVALVKNIQSCFIKNIPIDRKRMLFAGGAGFFVGLSPRVASIVVGETSRGGQGHDTDFLPTKLLAHLHSLLFKKGPQLFDFDRSWQSLISNPVSAYQVIFGFLFFALVAILLISVFLFFSENKGTLKNILTLKSMNFEPICLVLLAPLIVCFANIIVENGPEPRYLFPLFGSSALFVSIFVDKLKIKFKYISAIVLIIWLSFYSISNYRNFQELGLIQDARLVKREEIYIYDLIEFLEKKELSVAYSDYEVAGIATYLSGGRLNVSEYYINPVMKSRKKRGMKNPNFAVIAEKGVVNTYNNYLNEKNIEFEEDDLGRFKIYWDFSGDRMAINGLRSLIPGF